VKTLITLLQWLNVDVVTVDVVDVVVGEELEERTTQATNVLLDPRLSLRQSLREPCWRRMAPSKIPSPNNPHASRMRLNVLQRDPASATTERHCPETTLLRPARGSWGCRSEKGRLLVITRCPTLFGKR